MHVGHNRSALEKISAPKRAALLDWGLSFLESGEVERAASVLEGVARLEPEDPVPWAGAALAAMLAGRRDRAEAYFLELLARHPNGPLTKRLRPLF